LIREFVPPKSLKVRVLSDAFYLCPVAMRACQTRGFHWFSVASKNRNVIRTPGTKRGQIASSREEYLTTFFAEIFAADLQSARWNTSEFLEAT
jgi:hypothetical protein